MSKRVGSRARKGATRIRVATETWGACPGGLSSDVKGSEAKGRVSRSGHHPTLVGDDSLSLYSEGADSITDMSNSHGDRFL